MRILCAVVVFLLLASITYAALPEGFEIPDRPLTLEEKAYVEDLKANNRWIVPKERISANILQSAGCKILHDLNEAFGVKCPSNVRISGAFEDRLLYPTSIQSAAQINADDVWNLGYTGQGQVIAVLDTGIDANHPKLENDIIGGRNFVWPIPYLIPPVPSRIEDDHGHGTAVAGIITADSGEEKGISPQTKIWVGRVCYYDPNSPVKASCRTSEIADAIEYIVEGPDGVSGTGDEPPTKVISMSIGGGVYFGSCDYDYLADKVNWAVDSGVTMVVAAGNNYTGISSPGCASKAITVGAVDSGDFIAGFSGRGVELDVVAPGVNVKTTSGSTPVDYSSFSGTSAATPHVSAVVALLRGFEPNLDVQKTKDALYKSTKDLGTSGWDSTYGNGRVDALAAIRKIHDISVDGFSGPSQAQRQVAISLRGTFFNNGVFSETFSYTVKDLTDNVILKTDSLTLSPSESRIVNVPVTFSSSATAGNHVLELRTTPVTRELDAEDNAVTTLINVQEGVIHDVGVYHLSAPSSAIKGTPFDIQTQITNRGNVLEAITYRVFDATDNAEMFTHTISLGPGESYQRTVNLLFGSSASTGIHSLKVEALPVPGETYLDDNALWASINVRDTAIRDVAVTDFVVPTDVVKGTSFVVDIGVKNEGTAGETFTYTIKDLTANAVMYQRTLTLEAGGWFRETPTLNFGDSTATGTHNIEARIEPVSGETDTTDNVRTGNINVQDRHDLALTSFTGPSSTTRGTAFGVAVNIQNEGTASESLTYVIKDLTSNTEMYRETFTLSAGNSISKTALLTFSNTAATGLHTLEARVLALPLETDTTDNAKTISVNVVSSTVHDVSVDSLTITPSPVVRGKSVSISIVASNKGTATETFRIRVQDTTDRIGAFTGQVTLAPGETRTVKLGAGGTITSSLSIGTHSVYAKVDPLAGETNTANNVKTKLVNVQ